MGIVIKWSESDCRPVGPDEYVDCIDLDRISELQNCRQIDTRDRYYEYKANLEVEHGDSTTVRLIYSKEGNEELLNKSEPEIHLGTSTFLIFPGQRCGTLEWVDKNYPQDPISVPWHDSRNFMTYYQVLAKPEQRWFREQVMAIFASTCAVTGCKTEEVLEAAHIRPVSEGGSYAPDNGILLRRDIHRLFDRNLLAIHPGSLEVKIAKSITDAYYKEYRETLVELPPGGPEKSSFSDRWEKFNSPV